MRGLDAMYDEYLNGRPARASSPRGNGLLRIVDYRPVDLDRVEVEQSVLVCTEASNVEAVGTAHGSVDTLTRLPVGQPVPVADLVPVNDRCAERDHTGRSQTVALTLGDQGTLACEEPLTVRGTSTRLVQPTGWWRGPDMVDVLPASRREALVMETMVCVAEKGFEGLRLRDVAARAGIDHSTLHHHFATKQDLVHGVVEHVVQQFWPTMPLDGPAPARLHQHLTALARMIRERPLVFAVMSELDQRAHYDPLVRATLLKHERGWRAVLGELFANTGSWRVPLDVDAAVELVIAVVKGVSRSPDTAASVLGQLEALLMPPHSGADLDAEGVGR